MSKKIIQLNEGAIKDELKELVRGSVEETLNELLDQEAQALTEYVARVEHGASHALYTGVAKTGHIRRTHCTLTC